MLVGGVAANYYGRVRATNDIDIVMALEEPSTTKLLAALRKQGFQYHPEEISMLANLSNRFAVADPSGLIRIDIWIPKTSYEKRAFQRRRWGKIDTLKVSLISAEDLILFKLIAGRPHDIVDAQWVLKTQEKRLDKKHISFWTAALDLGKQFKKLKKK